jgi:UDP-N-acetylglucosamine/UDP-N-acetylgalactosamine diphosphorylase
MDSYQELKSKLTKYGQQHLLRFWDELNDKQKERLTQAINEIDFDNINELIPRINQDKQIEKNIQQPDYISLKPEEEDTSLLQGKDNFHHQMHMKGEELLKQGKIAAFVVAGGQGTRLGYDEPKGTFPIGPVTGKSLFWYHFGKLKTLQQKYNTKIPFLIMTSEMTHEPTIQYMKDNDFFGYDKDMVFIFQQGKMPAMDMDGRIYLAEKDYPAFSPNGHGGSVFALRNSGTLDKLIEMGIEHIFYFQVDNVLVRMCEPYFIGCHTNKDNDITLKVIEKAYPEEKLGVYVINNGKPFIIEYSDLTKEEQHEKDSEGKLKYRLGSHAIHLLSAKFMKEFTDKHKHLPYHKAVKKIPHINQDGERVQPDKPNGVKFEMFIFDILGYSTVDRVTAVEGLRDREFAPLKNKTGKDSIDTARASLIKDNVRRLKQAGVADIPTDSEGNPKHNIEISPYYRIMREELKAKVSDIIIDKDIYIGD